MENITPNEIDIIIKLLRHDGHHKLANKVDLEWDRGNK